MKSDQRGKVVELLQRKIPRSAQGDPNFAALGPSKHLEDHPDQPFLLDVFTPDEVVVMVNRFLYQAEYQRGWHRQWERRKALDLEPLKQKVVKMFGLMKWTQATDDQLRQAKAQLLKEEKETQHG